MKHRRGTVQAVGQFVAVKDDTGATHFLGPVGHFTFPKGVEVGDEGTLEYRTGPNYGLWFFDKDEELRHYAEQDCECRTKARSGMRNGYRCPAHRAQDELDLREAGARMVALIESNVAADAVPLRQDDPEPIFP